MNLDELRAEARRRADDAVGVAQFVDADLARFAAEAEREACVRAKLIYDPGIVIAVSAAQETVSLSAVIDLVDSATFTASTGGQAQAMDLTGIDALQEECDWQTRTATRPWKLAVQSRRKVRLWPAPSVAGTLRLAVYRYPKTDMEDGEDEPEIAIEHHDGLVDWMLYRMLDTKDGELGNKEGSAKGLSDFTNRFGERSDADVQRRHRERRRITTRCI